MASVTPFLWFDNNAQDALKLYSDTFHDFDTDYKEGDPLFLASFSIMGQQFMVLNGGPMFKLSEAYSMFVSVETQEEIDYYWSKLSEGGEEQMCGWLKDRFGVSWQIVPDCLGELMGDPDDAVRGRVHQAMLASVKFDIAALKAAAQG